MCVASLVRKSIVACPTWLTIYHYPWLFYSFSEKEKRGTERDDLSLYGRTFTGLECNFDFFGLPRRRTSAGIVRCLPIVTWFNAQTLRREEHTENKRKEYCRDLRRWTMFVLPFPTQSRPILSWSKGQGQEIDTQVFFFLFFSFFLSLVCFPTGSSSIWQPLKRVSHFVYEALVTISWIHVKLNARALVLVEWLISLSTCYENYRLFINF